VPALLPRRHNSTRLLTRTAAIKAAASSIGSRSTTENPRTVSCRGAIPPQSAMVLLPGGRTRLPRRLYRGPYLAHHRRKFTDDLLDRVPDLFPLPLLCRHAAWSQESSPANDFSAVILPNFRVADHPVGKFAEQVSVLT